jgi:hypothetical protein
VSGSDSVAESSRVRTETGAGPVAEDSAGAGAPLDGRKPPEGGRYTDTAPPEPVWALAAAAGTVEALSGRRIPACTLSCLAAAAASSITGPGAGWSWKGWWRSERGLSME